MMSSQPDDDDDRPEFLRLLFPRKRTTSGAVVPLRPMPVDQGQPYAMKALTSELDELARTGEGGRNDQLNDSAFNLAQLVAGGYLDRGQVEDALRSTALNIGLPAKEVENTLASAFKAGEAQPRQVELQPQLDVPQVTVLPTVLAKAEELARGEGSDEDKAAAAAAIESLFPLVNWKELYADQSTDEWLLEPLIPARRLTALFSPPKMGKSLLVLEVAVRISLGHETLGAKPPKGGVRVLYVDFENDPRGDVRTRLKAMGWQPEHLGNLCYLSFPSLAYLDTAMGGLQLLAVAQHYGVALVIIDTISRAVQGEENDNDTWLGFYRNTGVRLKSAGIACLRLDHTGKDTSKGMRGGSAKYGDVDLVWSMTALSDDTFRLECTANRLPVAEKLLTVRRKVGPLRHEVDTSGIAGLVKEAVALLDKLDVPLSLGQKKARDALVDAGHHFTYAVAGKAQAMRKDRPIATEWHPQEDS